MEEKEFRKLQEKKKKLDNLVENFASDKQVTSAMADFWSSFKYELGKEIMDEINKVSKDATNIDCICADDKMRQLTKLTKLQKIVICDVDATMESISVIVLKESLIRQYKSYKGIARLLRMLVKSCVLSK